MASTNRMKRSLTNTVFYFKVTCSPATFSYNLTTPSHSSILKLKCSAHPKLTPKRSKSLSIPECVSSLDSFTDSDSTDSSFSISRRKSIIYVFVQRLFLSTFILLGSIKSYPGSFIRRKPKKSSVPKICILNIALKYSILHDYISITIINCHKVKIHHKKNINISTLRNF